MNTSLIGILLKTVRERKKGIEWSSITSFVTLTWSAATWLEHCPKEITHSPSNLKCMMRPQLPLYSRNTLTAIIQLLSSDGSLKQLSKLQVEMLNMLNFWLSKNNQLSSKKRLKLKLLRNLEHAAQENAASAHVVIAVLVVPRVPQLCRLNSRKTFTSPMKKPLQ